MTEISTPTPGGKYPGVTVVIVNYYTADLIARCINSLDGSPVARVAVIDNSNSDSEVLALSNISSSNLTVEVFRNSGNLGFGHGVNTVIQKVDPDDSEIVWILNPDMRVDPDTVTNLLEAYLRSEFSVLSPVIYYDRPGLPQIWYGGGSFRSDSGRVEHWDFDRTALPDTEVWEVDFMTGAAVMLSGHSWRAVGGYRDDLFMYWEDVEWSIRASRVGLKMGVCRSAKVHHQVGAASSTKGMSKMFYYYNCRNRLIVLQDREGVIGLMKGRRMIETLRNVLRPLRREERTAKLVKTLSALSGTAAGFANRTARP